MVDCQGNLIGRLFSDDFTVLRATVLTGNGERFFRGLVDVGFECLVAAELAVTGGEGCLETSDVDGDGFGHAHVGIVARE